MKLIEKSRAYILTDEFTPILGPFVRRVMFLHITPVEVHDDTEAMRIWGSMYPKDEQYRNEPAAWMDDYVATVLPDARVKPFLDWLDTTTKLEDLLNPPLLQEPKPAKSGVLVVADGTILPVGSTFDSQLTRKTPQELKEKFDLFKSKKVADGTWVDKPRPQKRKVDISDSTIPTVDAPVTPEPEKVAVNLPVDNSWTTVSKVTEKPKQPTVNKTNSPKGPNRARNGVPSKPLVKEGLVNTTSTTSTSH